MIELWADGRKYACFPDPDEEPQKDICKPMKDRTNCPNCGAPYTYGQTAGCEYCGTGLPAKAEPRLRTEKDGKIVTSTMKMDASSIEFISSLMTVDELREMMGYGRGPAIGET